MMRVKFEEHTVAVAQMSLAHWEIEVTKALISFDEPFRIFDFFMVEMRICR